MTRLRHLHRRADRNPICCALALVGLWLVMYGGLMLAAAMMGIAP